MKMTKRHWVIIGIGFLVAVVAAFSWTHRAKAPTPAEVTNGVASSTEPTVTGTPATATNASGTETAPYTGPFPINPLDTIASWDFKGPYAGNETLIAQANADIAHLTSLIGGGQYDDYDLYDGIANDYASIGNGKTAYQYYDRAIRIHPAKGLGYANLGHLMDGLGAYHTAADAYTKAVTVEPGMLEYRVEQLNYLTGRFPSDTALVAAAFASASKQFGDTSAILSIEARWLTGQGRYADAIKAWQTVKALSPASSQAAIDAEIARLQAKQ